MISTFKLTYRWNLENSIYPYIEYTIYFIAILHDCKDAEIKVNDPRIYQISYNI